MDKLAIDAFPAAMIITTITAMMLTVLIAWSRIVNRSEAERKERFLAVWRPLFAEYIKGSAPATPPLEPQDIHAFCGLWNFWHSSLRGGALNGLHAIGNTVGLSAIAIDMLRKGSTADRLLAAVILGNMEEVAALDDLRSMANLPDPIVSLSAARAILQINRDQAVNTILDLCGSRTDWALPRVASMLQGAGTTLISQPLAEHCLSSSPPEQYRFVRLLSCATRSVSEGTALSLLKRTTDAEVIAGCLRLLNSKSDHSVIVSYWDHEVWFVRLQAVKALARVSTGEDTPLFIRRLKDESWWVKFRAVEALAAIPTFDVYKWEQIAGKFVEPDLRRVLLQVTEARKSQ
jgi:hypothetical protein